MSLGLEVSVDLLGGARSNNNVLLSRCAVKESEEKGG